MADAFGELMERAREWFERAAGDGWFGEAERRRFEAVERGTPADLFTDEQARPLVVALFGGPGVGKSSLLNRLAGESLAEVGPERPTSREVTLYVHQAVQLAELPAELPVERVRVKRHEAAEYRDVLWIDAPDIDSTEEANRSCALAWLPHVDLLCYVVSPERYRDDVGWRVLRERGGKHGWMFVMNRWDEGDPRQCEDFLGMLREAGFEKPVLLRTCCAGAGRRVPDEMGELISVLRELQRGHAVSELARLGQRARVVELGEAIEELQERLGDRASWDQVSAALAQRWGQVRGQLIEGAAWAMQAIAGRFAVREGAALERVVKQLRRGGGEKQEAREKQVVEPAELAALTGPLWDEWSQGKVVGCVDAAEIAAGGAGLAAGPLRKGLEPPALEARKLVTAQAEDQVRAELVRPGGWMTRVARRATGFLMAVLPAAALAWVGYEVVLGYYRAATGHSEFFGSAFAVHSALLVAIAWLLPFVLDRLLRPSVEQAVARALRTGFARGLDELAGRLRDAVEAAADAAGEYRAQAAELLAAAGKLTAGPVAAQHEATARLVMRGAARVDSARSSVSGGAQVAAGTRGEQSPGWGRSSGGAEPERQLRRRSTQQSGSV